MPDGRCPSCGASVRANADWCTLCYADLRPAPPPPLPPPPPPVPAPVVAAPAPVAAPLAPVATVTAADPLTAPYDALLGAPLAGTALAPEPAAGKAAPMWPCTDCGASNPIEAAVCGTCGQPFGARFATKPDSDARRQRMLRVLAGLGVFLALLAAITWLATPEPPADQTEQIPVEIVP